MAQEKATIEKLNNAFVVALKNGDFAAVAALYTEDAAVLPPGATLIKGRSLIQAFWTKAGKGVSDIKLTTVDVKPIGPDTAREIGRFTLTTKEKQSQQVVGKYVALWQRVESTWKLANDVWISTNSLD
jgi:uncharacterized protein (TIGR02246 family)